MPIYNLKGACSGGRGYAEGTGKISSVYGSFETFDGNSYGQNYVEVKTFLGFIPSLIVIVIDASDVDESSIYKSDGWLYNTPNSLVKTGNTYYTLGNSAYINTNGFRLPFVTNRTDYKVKWRAYE